MIYIITYVIKFDSKMPLRLEIKKKMLERSPRVTKIENMKNEVWIGGWLDNYNNGETIKVGEGKIEKGVEFLGGKDHWERNFCDSKGRDPPADGRKGGSKDNK